MFLHYQVHWIETLFVFAYFLVSSSTICALEPECLGFRKQEFGVTCIAKKTLSPQFELSWFHCFFSMIFKGLGTNFHDWATLRHLQILRPPGSMVDVSVPRPSSHQSRNLTPIQEVRRQILQVLLRLSWDCIWYIIQSMTENPSRPGSSSQGAADGLCLVMHLKNDSGALN